MDDDEARVATVPASQASATRPDRPSRQPTRPARGSLPAPFDPPLVDRFDEQAELGRGGMGRVFEARDVALDRPVAIKQSLTDDPEMLERFEREALITARLQHPGIVPVLDAGRDAQGRPYYVMRKIEGEPLADRLRATHTTQQRLAFVPNMLAAVDAVAYAHARGVIHRDLKPWNVLVGEFGETFVIDWGLARDLASTEGESLDVVMPSDDGLTRAGSTLGTPGFMAPEQARGEPLDRRADVYALGASLVYLLSSKQPFADREPTAAVEAVARDEAPVIEFPDEVPAELRTIARKAISPAREARYADAGALASDLRAFLAGQLVAAHVYTRRERLARWLRKHRLAVAIAVVATIAVIVISTFAILRVVDARDQARRAQAAAADRADAMLVERAYSLATTDPAHALALLKQLPLGSHMWPRATAAAETAAAYGAGWGLPLARPDGWARIEPSPSGDVVAIAADETIYLVDPSLRTPPRLLVRFPADAAQVAWFGDELIAVVSRTQALVRIGRDGSQTELATGFQKAVELLTPLDGEHIFVRTGGHLLELDPDDGARVRDHGEVKAAERVKGGVLYQLGDAMFLMEDGKPAERLPAGTLLGSFLRADLARGRIVTWNLQEIVELERADGGWRERGRWTLDADAVVYHDDVLVAVEKSGIAYLFPGKPPRRDPFPVSRDRSIVRGAVIADNDGVFVASQHGVLTLADHPVLVMPFVEPLFAFAKAGPYILALTRTGTMRSWDLRTVVPQRIAVHRAAQPVAIDPQRAWISEMMFVTALDLATGTVHARIGADKLDESAFMCAGDKTLVRIEAEKRRQLAQPAYVAVFAPDGTITRVPGDYRDAVCDASGRWLALETTAGIELRDARAPEVPGKTFAIAAAIKAYALTDKWLAVLDVNGEVTRVDLATLAVDHLRTSATATAFSIDPRGRIATLDGEAITVWIGETSARVLDKVKVALLTAHDLGFLVFTLERTLVTIDQADRTRRFDLGEGARSIAGGAPQIALIVDGRLAVMDIRDGSVVQFPWIAHGAAIARDGRRIVTTSLGSGKASIVRMQVPREPREILRWLDDATNATLEPGSTDIRWQR